VESTVRMGFLSGMTSSGTRNPPEEYDSAGNNQLMEAVSDRQDQNVRKILKAVTISGSASTNPVYCGQLFKKFKYKNVIKMKNKLDPALLGGSYLFNEIKKRAQKSRETIPLSTNPINVWHSKLPASAWCENFSIHSRVSLFRL
jgi:hypothetical protein